MNKPKFTPGPWSVGYRAMHVDCENAKIGGEAMLFNVRGWGYLTGSGEGGLGLSAEEAYEIQKANAALAAAAPEMFAALEYVQNHLMEFGIENGLVSKALAKARGEGGEHVG